jgi:hypothetical protein
MTQKSQEPLACNVVIERLIGGERPSSDPALSEHVGSCLPCFRTASDLRGLPTLRRQLHEAQGELPDPGAAFWAGFPDRVTTAWEGQQESAPAATPVAARPRWQGLRDFWATAIAWLRLPVPAAGAGAFAAVAVVWLVMKAGSVGDATSEFPKGSAQAPNQAAVESESFATSSRESVAAADEALRDLDVNGLQKLQAELERSLAEGVPARPMADGDESMSTDPAGLSEDLDELNEAGLTVLAENLGESI